MNVFPVYSLTMSLGLYYVLYQLGDFIFFRIRVGILKQSWMSHTGSIRGKFNLDSLSQAPR